MDGKTDYIFYREPQKLCLLLKFVLDKERRVSEDWYMANKILIYFAKHLWKSFVSKVCGCDLLVCFKCNL